MERPGEEGKGPTHGIGNSDLERRNRNRSSACRSVVLASSREIEQGLAHRPCHMHAVRPRRKRPIEGVLYGLTELLPLRELLPDISHRPAALHDPLLETSE